MNRYLLSFPIQPGARAQVQEILASYGRPNPGQAAGGGQRPLLQRTSVFLTEARVLRVMDVAGELADVLRYLAAQPQIRAVEEKLNAYLTEPRDLDDPDGLRAFIRGAALYPVIQRVTPQQQRARVPDGQRGQRCALLYPLRPGCGGRAAEILQAAPALPVNATATPATLAATGVYRNGDVLVRLFEVDGSIPAALDHLADVASRAPSTAEFAALVDSAKDLTSRDGFRAFLDECSMSLVTDRRIGAPA